MTLIPTQGSGKFCIFTCLINQRPQASALLSFATTCSIDNYLRYFSWFHSNRTSISFECSNHFIRIRGSFDICQTNHSFEWNGSRIRMFLPTPSSLKKVYTFEIESIYSWGMKVYTLGIRKYILLTCESIYFFKSDIYRSWGASSLYDKWMSIAVNLFSKKSFCL